MNPLKTTIPAIEAPRLTVAIIGLVFLAGPVPAWTQSVERVGDDRVSIHAAGVPLGPLLRELATVAPLETLAIEEMVEN